jgi:hypothetical protein
LRCFPICSTTVHKRKSFCGYPLYVTVTFANEEEAAKATTLLGEFRNLSTNTVPAVISTVDSPLLESASKPIAATNESSRFVGRMYKQEKEKIFYIFMPPGKWHYDGKMQESDSHVFTATLLFDELIVAQQDSVVFHIIRKWHIVGNDIQSSGSAAKDEEACLEDKIPSPPRNSSTTSSSPSTTANMMTVPMIHPQQPNIHHVPRSPSNSGVSANILLSMSSPPCSPLSMQPKIPTASPSTLLQLPFYPMPSLPLVINDRSQVYWLDRQVQQQLGYNASAHLPFPFPSVNYLPQSPLGGRFSTYSSLSSSLYPQ